MRFNQDGVPGRHSAIEKYVNDSLASIELRARLRLEPLPK